MDKAFTDYYEPFKNDKEGISPSLSREENFKKFKSASARYSQLFGKDVELATIKSALGIFGNDEQYLNYRLQYVRYKLQGFIDGAADNNIITRAKYNGLIKNAYEAGISAEEVDKLLGTLQIKIGVKPKPARNTEEEDKKTKHAGEEKKQEQKPGPVPDRKPDNDPRPKQIPPRKVFKIIKDFATSKTGITIGIIAVLAIAGISFFDILPSGPSRTLHSGSETNITDPSSIDLSTAINYMSIQPPEYSKIEEAVRTFKANVPNQSAIEGLQKATDIYLKWGDDSPNPDEIRSMYQKALECNNAANGSRTEEIKSKLEEVTRLQ